jgi:hypothetical protein
MSILFDITLELIISLVNSPWCVLSKTFILMKNRRLYSNLLRHIYNYFVANNGFKIVSLTRNQLWILTKDVAMDTILTSKRSMLQAMKDVFFYRIEEKACCNKNVRQEWVCFSFFSCHVVSLFLLLCHSKHWWGGKNCKGQLVFSKIS